MIQPGPLLSARSFWELVEKRARATPDAELVIDEHDRRLTFSACHDQALRVAAALSERGVGNDTAVSWMLPTWIESMVLVAALSRLGARQNPILPIYRDKEVGFIANQSKPRLLIVPGVWRGFDYAEMANAVASSTAPLEVMAIEPSGSGGGLPRSSSPRDLPPPSPGRDPVRWLFYSSGTTAAPKGALHTDATLMATASGMSRALGLAADDHVAMVFPFTHIGGVGWLVSALMVGCRLIAVEAFDPKTSIDVLARNGVTQATAGTAFHQAYLAAQRERRGPPIFPNVRTFPGGGAPKPPQLHRDLAREIGGVGVVSGYGMTECPILAMSCFDDDDEKLAHTEGRASPPEVVISVVHSDGSAAKPGEQGEFRVVGPQLFKGYLDPALDVAAFDDQGRFRTGDLGFLDADGHVVVTGRLKDVIIRKGENISAKEVEDLLYPHPKLVDAAVIGLPDDNTGERCCAVVVCRDPAEPIGFDEMAQYLRDQGLMTQKIPEQLEIVDELPRNATGKVLKDALRARFASA